MKHFYLFAVFVLFSCCSSFNESLIVSEPIKSDQKDAADVKTLSSTARFLFGVIPLDGVDRFEENAFERLLFNVMSQQSQLDTNYELIGFENLVHRKMGILSYEIQGFYKPKKQEKLLVKKPTASLDSTRKEIAIKPNLSKALPKVTPKSQRPLGLETLLLALDKTPAAEEPPPAQVVVVACIRPEQFNTEALKRLGRRLKDPVKHFETENWVKIYVDVEANQQSLEAIRDIYPDAWICNYGQ